MSDTPQGPDWWQASDDKWYPPPRPEMPGEAAYSAAPPAAPVGVGYGAPPGAPPYGAPPVPPAPAPSPYGGVPAVPPPGQGGQNRTALFVTLGVLAAAALVVLVIAVSGDGNGNGNETADTTAADSPVTTREVDPSTSDTNTPTTGSTEPPSSGEIRLVDSGFSIYQDELSDAEESAYALVVENTTDQVARNIDITVGLLDAEGTVVDSDTLYLYVLMPGQTFGLGDAGFATGVTELSIDISEPDEWADPADFGEITAEGVTWEYDSFNDPIVDFTATSTYDRQLDGPSAYAIFRDAEGNLLGGYSSYMNFIPPNGSTVGHIETFDSIANVETAEVYVDPAIF